MLQAAARPPRQSFFNANSFLDEDVDKRRQAVCGAGGVGNDIHRGLVVIGVVDTHNKRLQIPLAWGRNDNLLRTGFQ